MSHDESSDADEERQRQREIMKLLTENAELRGDVAALWQTLGNLIGLIDRKGHMSAPNQVILRNAIELHANWKHG